VVEEAKHQERGKQRLPTFAAKPDQDSGIEHAQSRRRMACKAEQSRGNEHGHQPEQSDIQ
jgi:hypothetical protein